MNQTQGMVRVAFWTLPLPLGWCLLPSLFPKSGGAGWGILGANLCFRMSPATASPVLQACTGQENWSPGTASSCTQSGASPGQPHWLPRPRPTSEPPHFPALPLWQESLPSFRTFSGCCWLQLLFLQEEKQPEG